LLSGSAAFQRAERRFSLVWGVMLLAECVARVVGAYTLPVDTMVWLGTVVMIGTIAVTSVISGGVAVGPMAEMIDAELKTEDAPAPAVMPSLVAAR
jgi:hypothetical protein